MLNGKLCWQCRFAERRWRDGAHGCKRQHGTVDAKLVALQHELVDQLLRGAATTTSGLALLPEAWLDMTVGSCCMGPLSADNYTDHVRIGVVSGLVENPRFSTRSSCTLLGFLVHAYSRVPNTSPHPTQARCTRLRPIWP